MKIVIFGAKGNLGSQLQKIFSKKSGFIVYAWDRDDLDMTDKDLVSEKISAILPDVIINAVAYNAVDKCEEDEKELALAMKLNQEVPAFLASLAQKIQATLVHYSSDYVFSGNSSAGYNERSKPDPINKYGLSKFEGEKAIAREALNGNLKWYLIRTSKLFGPKGTSPAAKPSFFDIMLKLAGEKNELSAVNEEKSCFTYTPDLAQATFDIIEKKSPFGIYHITNSLPATWHEAGLKLFEIAGLDKKLIPISSDKFPRPAKRPKYSQLMNTKIKPLRSYEEALKEYFERSEK
jgi:dTDP-4-dehydrorhamnose reductase